MFNKSKPERKYKLALTKVAITVTRRGHPETKELLVHLTMSEQLEIAFLTESGFAAIRDISPVANPLRPVEREKPNMRRSLTSLFAVAIVLFQAATASTFTTAGALVLAATLMLRVTHWVRLSEMCYETEYEARQPFVLGPEIKHKVPREKINSLFFSCTIYRTEEFERILLAPVWLQSLRRVYVRSLGWLPPQTRGYLGLR